MENWINCCTLSLVLAGANILQLVFFFNYSLKLKDKNIVLEKNDQEQEKKHSDNEQRIELLEEKNGQGLEEKKRLQSRIDKLEEIIGNLTKPALASVGSPPPPASSKKSEPEQNKEVNQEKPSRKTHAQALKEALEKRRKDLGKDEDKILALFIGS